MFPFEFVSDSVHPPLPILPFSESPASSPLAVTGSSLVMRPNEVRAVRSYPAFSGRRTCIGEKEVLAVMLLQLDEARADEIETTPF